MRPILALLCVSCWALAPAFSATLYVDGVNGDDAWSGRCAKWDGRNCGPKRTIQAGLDAAKDGDKVIVADGVYRGELNRELSFGGRSIKLQSASGSERCIIDCEGLGRGVVFAQGESSAALVRGFTIINGHGRTGAGPGGAIYCGWSHPTIEACQMRLGQDSGYERSGAGIYLHMSDAVIRDCVIAENGWPPGNIHFGGGIFGRYSNPTIERCEIRNNCANEGGGIALIDCSSAQIRDCRISDNLAGIYSNGGGGIFCLSSKVSIENCAIQDNTAYGHHGNAGAGVHASECQVTMRSCVVARNRLGQNGAGIWVQYGKLTLSNCTVISNGGWVGVGGTDITSSTISNSIIRGNAAGQIKEFNGSFGVTYSNVEGGRTGTGNIDKDPGFAFGDDYHLMSGSPCIDRGSNSPPGGLSTVDSEGVKRPIDGDDNGQASADMGAFEFSAADPRIAISPTELLFVAPAGGDPPAEQELSIRNCGGNTLLWDSAIDVDWLEIDPPGGQSDGETSKSVVRVVRGDFPPGEYRARIRVADAGAMNSPQYADVTLRLNSIRRVPGDHATIQEAIDAAVPGDSILVADGVYTGRGNKDLNLYHKDIPIRSEHGPWSCVLDLEGQGNAFRVAGGQTATTVIDGFTIRNGGWNGDGIVYLWNATPIISNCQFLENRGGTPLLADQHAHATVVNCIFFRNKSYGFGAIQARSAELAITNCTIIGNSSYYYDGVAIAAYWKDAHVTNCIVRDNANGQLGYEHLIVTYSNIQGGRSGTGNIDRDPRFAFPDDLHITRGSPSIDRGNDNPYGGLAAVDIDGVDRTQDGNDDDVAVVDMGAFEVYGQGSTIAASPSTMLFIAQPDAIDVPHQTLRIRNAGGKPLKWTIRLDQDWASVDPDSGISDDESDDVKIHVETAGLTYGSHLCRLTIQADDASNNGRVVPVTLHITGAAHVPAQFPSIKAAINYAQNGDTVLVADGTYSGEDNRELLMRGKQITVRSERGPENCIIDCEGAGPGFLFMDRETPATIIDGLTIRNGARYSGGAVFGQDGSGPNIRNCTLTRNTAHSGGAAIDIDGDVLLENCVLTDNTAMGGEGIGGAVVLRGTRPVMTDCLIGNNHSYNSGAGIACGDATIENCTIANNKGEYLVGGLSTWGHVQIRNCIVWGNDNGSLELTETGEVSVTYSDIEGGWSGKGNQNRDPQFADSESGNYRLSPKSPCIDAGDPNYVAAPGETDLDGLLRAWDGNADSLAIIDMGAYEFASRPYGDLNCDGAVDFNDIDAFITALLGRGDYESIYPDCQFLLADINADGSVDINDIDGFVDCLIYNGCG